MNLLNNVFNTDKNMIMEVNKRNMIVVVLIILIIMILSVFLKREYYYSNIITKVGDNYVLIVDNNIIKEIQTKNKLIINNIEKKYSINKIETLEDTSFLYIDLNIENLSDNVYKIYLGKETLLEYIIRIIKK